MIEFESAEEACICGENLNGSKLGDRNVNVEWVPSSEIQSFHHRQKKRKKEMITFGKDRDDLESFGPCNSGKLKMNLQQRIQQKRAEKLKKKEMIHFGGNQSPIGQKVFGAQKGRKSSGKGAVFKQQKSGRGTKRITRKSYINMMADMVVVQREKAWNTKLERQRARLEKKRRNDYYKKLKKAWKVYENTHKYYDKKEF